MTEKKSNNFVMYHFTNENGWKGVNEGTPDVLYLNPITGLYVDGRTVRGLWPSRRLIAQGLDSALVPSEATNSAVFGLPEEKPQSWIHNHGFNIMTAPMFLIIL